MVSISTTSTLHYVFVGAFATAILDVWSVLLNRALGAPITNWGLVGRWVVGILSSGAERGIDIQAAPGAPHEQLLGWSTHYLVGVTYAGLYFASLAAVDATPSAYSAGLFGLVTVLAPWLILQPGLGLGYFATRARRPNLTRTLNVVSHLVFGIGLYLGWALSTLAR